MEGLTLAAGIILMLVAAIGIVFYVALVIAIPVCRMLDWVFDKETDERVIRPSPFGRATRAAMKWVGEIAHRTIAYFCRYGGEK
jgi:hypothetical protein